MGIECLIVLIKDVGGELVVLVLDVYLVYQGDEVLCLVFWIVEGLWDQGVNVLLYCGGGSFKLQMKKVDGSGVVFVVIIGDDEVLIGEVQFKLLCEEGVVQ